MSRETFSLLRTRRFLPLFLTQFLGAFNDNVYKNAVVILITYRIGATVTAKPELLVTLAAGIFILPFFLFSATAGALADKYEKARLIRLIKLVEIAIMGLGLAAFWLADVWFLLAVLFLMGTHSAFFGPLKYAILPDHLKDDELIGGNGLIEAATFVAILLGTVLGGIIVLQDGGIITVAAFCILLAVLGYVTSTGIPATTPTATEIVVPWNIVTATKRLMVEARQDPVVRAAMIGISWFWFLGATYLAQFPNLAKNTLHADETVVVLFLVLFAIGIAVGSLLCNIVLKGRISMRYVPPAAVLLGLLSVVFYGSIAGYDWQQDKLLDAAGFMVQPGGWAVILCLLLIATAGGFFSVPLYALIQARMVADHRARAIAALNIQNSAFMVGSAVIAAVVLALGVDVALLLAAVGVVTIPLGLWLRRALQSAR